MALTKVTGEFIDISDLDLSDVGTISLDAIQGDADANTSITFSGSDVITIATGGSGRLTIGDGALSPVTDNQIDLGTASLEFKDAFFDGTVTADAFAGPLTGNVTGNASGTALTVTQAAQTAITSVGTLTGLTVSGGVGMTGGWGRTALLSHNFPVLVFESEYSSSAFAGIGYDNTTGLKFFVNAAAVDVTAGSGNPALAMTILDNHNVGIGTAAPDSILHLYEDDSSAGNTQLHIENDKTDDAAVLKIEGKRTSANDSGQILFANNNNFPS